jgi:cold shock protein
MPFGFVKWYDCRRGYGFIVTPEGEDVLAHFTAIEGTGYRSLLRGEEVEYEARRTEKGLQATMVRHLKPVVQRWDPPSPPPPPDAKVDSDPSESS